MGCQHAPLPPRLQSAQRSSRLLRRTPGWRTVLSLAFALSWPGISASPVGAYDGAPAKLYLDPSGVELGALGSERSTHIDSARFVRTLQEFTGRYPTREIGTPGNAAAAHYIASVFDSLGLSDVTRQEITAGVARQHYAYAYLPLGGGQFDSLALWSYHPNFARTNTIPPDGLRGHLAYTVSGEAHEYNGQEMEGSILLAEMTVENRWRLASTLGSKAAIFIESDNPNLNVAAWFNTSVNFPRFWIPREPGLRLKAWAEAHPNEQIILKAKQPWEHATGYNVVGFLPGSDPVLSHEVIIITAPFDAASPVLGIAPGAEAALSITTELELAHLLAENPLPRSVLFVALNGQFSDVMAGGRNFVLALKQSYPTALRRNIEFLRKDIRLISDRKLAGKFPEYRAEALALEDALNRVVSHELAEAQRRWDDLMKVRKTYREDASPKAEQAATLQQARKDRNAAKESARLGAALYQARQDHVAAMEEATAQFVPAFDRAADALIPIIAEFGRLHREFILALEQDRRRLQPIVDADEDKIRTSVAGRLAAARLSDIRKALNKVTRMSANDHEQRLQRLRDQLALIRPVLGRYPALLVDLSVTSNSDNVGLFYKGYFYNQQPDLELKRVYGDLGKRFAAYATNLVVVNDLERLWGMSDEEIRSLIRKKIDDIDAKREEYRKVEGVATSDTEVFYTYSWYQRFFNATAWFWGLVLAGAFGYLIRRTHEPEDAPPRWYWGGVASGALLTLYSLLFGMDWKNTTKVYHGIDQLIWNNTDLLINAEQIPREEKTKIRLAAEKHKRYTEMVETPEFFADNIINAIPATLHKLRQDSIIIAQQLVLFQKLAPLRTVPPVDLRAGQLDTLNQFIAFLALQGNRRFVDCVAGTQGKGWNNYLPGVRYFTSEIATLAGIPAVALSTIDDRAPFLNSIHDTYDRLDIPRVLTQTRTIVSLMTQAFIDPTLPDDFVMGDYYAQADGAVLFDDRQSSVTADEPVDSAIVIADRGYLFRCLSDRRGNFNFIGLPLDGHAATAVGGTQWLHAYKTDPDSGNIFYAIDLGSKQYAFEPKVAQLTQDWTVVVFPCASVSVTDLMDQRYFQYLAVGDVYDARTDSKPWHYFAHISRGDNTFFVDEGTRVKLTFAQGLLGMRMMLTGVPDTIRIPENRQGVGFPVVREALLTHTAYQAARDMRYLNEGRLVTLVRHGIIDEETRAVHDSASAHLRAATQALADKQYDVYLTEARTALALESRVLPDVLSIANGALKGVLFYMALLLPFAFFLERLLIGATDVRNQALWFFGIFILMFVLIEQVHPAFDITVAPPMVLLAFTVFALSLFVVTIIITKFTAQMQQIRKEQQGYLSADVGRISAMFTAFLLGVSNMRKRKIRTGLTCTTLILLTFTVLSFTSVREYLRVNRIRLSGETPVYSGVLIRDRFWNFWPPEMLSSIRNEMRRENIVVGRAWREAFYSGADFFFTLYAENGKSYTLSGFVGMEPDEDKVTGIFTKAGVAGRWFQKDDIFALVIPQTAATALGITREQVTGDAATAPKVAMKGVKYSVVGILDDETLRHVKDIDGEELTSVNWQLVEQQRQSRQQQLQSGKQITQASERETYIHLVPAQCMFVPFRIVQGGLVSVVIKTPDYRSAESLVTRVIPKWALEMYVGQEGGTYLYSAMGLTTLGGLKDVFIPILIAALIVLNTMLGAVFERTREIGIFSSVGLAPSHIAMLFMAEAVVYAVLGAIAGYLLGQTVGQIIYKTGVLGGVTLNYSSVSTITSTLIVMLTVLLSTIYPAKRASEISVPDIARTWKLPEPSGDEWYFALPFTLMDEELEGVNAFLAHFFESHHDESSSDFYIDRVDFWAEDGRFMLETMVWLAPYDLGVSELVTLISSPIPEEKNLYSMSLLVTRESGDVPSWNRVNRRFVNFLRKQFLIWRTLTPNERRMFTERGRKMFSIDGKRAIERSQMVEA